MREILFRGKHIHAHPKNEHLDGRWVYGYLCDKNYINSPELEGEILVDPETVCQYTGLTDKNVRKIFENDVVKEGSSIGIVKFGRYGNGFHFGYFIDWINCPLLRNELWFWSNRLDVVGNIFDNQELIQGRRGDTYGKMG